MAFRVQGEIRGLKELIAKLGDLKPKIAKKYTRAAMGKGTSVVNKGTKQDVAVGPTGQTKRSIGGKVKVYPSGVVVGIVEPRKGFKVPLPSGRNFVKVRYHDPRRIAHLIERGTKPRRTKGGANRGSVRARPFLWPAFTRNEQRILAIFGDKVDEALATL